MFLQTTDKFSFARFYNACQIRPNLHVHDLTFQSGRKGLQASDHCSRMRFNFFMCETTGYKETNVQ